MEIAGYAAVFNQETVIAGLFREKIAPGAFRDAIKRDDVRAFFNHDPNVVLGRKSTGTLKLREDARGLHYTITVNDDDPDAARVVAKVRRRDVTGSSFWFGIDNPATDEEWTPGGPGQLPLRTLWKLRLVDVSPVSLPAYEAATAAVRAPMDPIAARELARAQVEIAKARAR